MNADVMHRGEWYSVIESPTEILNRLRNSNRGEMICLTQLDNQREFWLRADQIDAIAEVAPEDEPGQIDDDILERVISELEAGRFGPMHLCPATLSRITPRRRGDHS